KPIITTSKGNVGRSAEVTGAKQHLVEPLGYTLDDKHLKRAGLDYHDLADLNIHADFDDCMEALPDARIFAFTTSATKWFSDVEYTEGDILLFGTEPSGLPAEHLAHPRITEEVRIPMVP